MLQANSNNAPKHKKKSAKQRERDYKRAKEREERMEKRREQEREMEDDKIYCSDDNELYFRNEDGTWNDVRYKAYLDDIFD
jgi:hypothetical protein